MRTSTQQSDHPAVSVEAQIRHADGSTEPPSSNSLENLDDQDLLEIRASSEGSGTFACLISIGSDDSINVLGETFMIEEASFATAFLTGSELPHGISSLALIIGPDEETIRDLLESEGVLSSSVVEEFGLDLVLFPGNSRHAITGDQGVASSGEDHLLEADVFVTDTDEVLTITADVAGGYGGLDRAPVEAMPGADEPGIVDAAGPSDEPPVESAQTRTVHARLDAPDRALVGEEFVVTGGLAEAAQLGVFAGPFMIPTGEVRLEVQLIAFGFDISGSETWRRDLLVTSDDPFPSVTWHVRAQSTPSDDPRRPIKLKYVLDGQVLGFAERFIEIGPPRDLPPRADAETSDTRSLTVPAEVDQLDMTISILRAEVGGAGNFIFAVDTRHPIAKPDPPHAVQLGAEGPEYLRRLTEDIEEREGGVRLESALKGLGRRIGDRIPPDVWTVLSAVHDHIGRAPEVLLVTEEIYVPWELAYMDDPLDTNRPRFFGAQAIVGRWPARVDNPPPTDRPLRETEVDTIAVVNGHYTEGWEDLVHAREESEFLRDNYSAEIIDAKAADIIALLRREPSSTVLHFAMHGKADAGGYQEGLQTTDNQPIGAYEVEGNPLSRTPFVFLNACQVAAAEGLLGDYSGIAAAFLKSGACGVIAPLWKIDDAIAKNIALALYEKALRNNEAPAAILRDERAAWVSAPTSSTFLAYQFWGHPSLRLKEAATQ